MICLEQQWDEQGHELLSFFIQIRFRSEHFISLINFLQAESLIWQVMFILEINSRRLPALISTTAGEVNLLYHTSSRGHFLFHNLQICFSPPRLRDSAEAIVLHYWRNNSMLSCQWKPMQVKSIKTVLAWYYWLYLLAEFSLFIWYKWHHMLQYRADNYHASL